MNIDANADAKEVQSAPTLACRDCQLDLGDAIAAVFICPRFGKSRVAEPACESFQWKTILPSAPSHAKVTQE